MREVVGGIGGGEVEFGDLDGGDGEVGVFGVVDEVKDGGCDGGEEEERENCD